MFMTPANSLEKCLPMLELTIQINKYLVTYILKIKIYNMSGNNGNGNGNGNNGNNNNGNAFGNAFGNNQGGLALGRMKRLTAATKSAMKRQRLFRKLKDFYNADPENNDINIAHTNLTNVLASCGYHAADFGSDFNLSSLKDFTEIPEKQVITGKLEIRQGHLQNTAELFKIQCVDGNDTETGAIVITGTSVPSSGTAELLTTEYLASEQGGTEVTWYLQHSWTNRC